MHIDESGIVLKQPSYGSRHRGEPPNDCGQGNKPLSKQTSGNVIPAASGDSSLKLSINSNELL